MGAVKRTHKRTRIDQQTRKFINRACDRHHIRPRCADAYMRLIRPDLYNKIYQAIESMVGQLLKVAIPAIDEAIKELSEVTHDGESRTGT